MAQHQARVKNRPGLSRAVSLLGCVAGFATLQGFEAQEGR
jgi:hypothetical protein